MNKVENLKLGLNQGLFTKEEILNLLSEGKITYDEYVNVIGMQKITETIVDEESGEETQVEKLIEPEVDLEILKQAKMQEIRLTCNEEILKGFYSDSDGELKKYSMEYEDQINIESLKNNLVAGLVNEVSYYASGEECKIYTKEQFLDLYTTGMTFKTERITTCKSIISQIKNATTKEELDTIQWMEYDWNLPSEDNTDTTIES